MKNKHAYLIIAHSDFDILEKLLILLDDNRNDIFIHIDKKVKNFNFEYFKNITNQSNIYFVPRIKVFWGDYSLIKCELLLLKQAVKGNYSYYHLLSGVDFPLKTQDEIHDFFDNKDCEFIHYCTPEQIKNARNRVLEFHFLMPWYKSSNKYIRFLCYKINQAVKILQNKLNYKRHWDKTIKIMYGSNWFSITNELAKYIVSKEKWIKEHFKYAICADEIFVQTIVYNSNFKNKLYWKNMDDNYLGIMRYIDWKRGGPYVFRNEDYEELINSQMMFARKFSTEVDSDIIEKLFNHNLNKNGSENNN